MVKNITKAPQDDLVYLPLGGSGEIGMNMTLYGHQGKWLIVDMGITFADETMPGVDIVVPDPAFLMSQREQISGLVITHAHEDHLGAVIWIWDKIRCPIWATPFAISVLKAKFRDQNMPVPKELRVLDGTSSVSMGPFEVSSLSINHSVPQPQSIVIRTKKGIVVHSGDWTLDDDPLIDKSYDTERFRAVGDEGVLALICDSTNVFVKESVGSERALLENLTAIIRKISKGRIITTSFASNVARMLMFAHAAKDVGRQSVLIGRSMLRFADAARENGYLDDGTEFLSDREAKTLTREKALYICTGSQGESRSALSRIAEGSHPSLALDAGDTVIFSSSVIPGNEKAVSRVQNLLLASGITVITESDAFVHISGHPGRPELQRMYDLLRPQIVVPAHGELRHLREHTRFAKECGIKHAVEVINGQAWCLSNGTPSRYGTVESNTLALLGNRLLPTDDPIFRDRERILAHGALNVVLIVDSQAGLCHDPLVTQFGMIGDGEESVLEEIAQRAEEELGKMSERAILRKGKGSVHIRSILTSFIRQNIGRTPFIRVDIVEV